MNRRWLTVLACVGSSLGIRAGAGRQGLIVHLPKRRRLGAVRRDGEAVEFRPDAPEGDISMEWIQHLTIKSVGSESILFHRKQVPCRWIEIKVLTGKPSESGVEPGPVGERIYKILVPEERVIEEVADGGKIPCSYLDIVKGFRKMGGTVTPIPLGRNSEGHSQVYPLAGPLMHYDAVEAAGRAAEELQVPGGTVRAKKFKRGASSKVRSCATTSDAEIWRCDPQKFRSTREVVDENHDRPKGRHRGAVDV